VVPTTPASLSRYCLVDVESFPSPFSGELFGGGGGGFVSLDPLHPLTSAVPPPSNQYQLGSDMDQVAGYHPQQRGDGR